MHGDEQAVHVIDRQRVQQHVAAREAPGLDERQRIRRQIAVRERSALRPAGRARRVENCREVVRPRHHGFESGGFGCRTVVQFAAAVRVDRQHRRFVRDRRHGAKRFGPADDDARLCVVEKELELGPLVARIERQIDESCAQAREIERQHAPVLVGLHGNAVAGHAAGPNQRVREPCRFVGKVAVVDHRAVGRQNARHFPLAGKVSVDKRVQIGVHRVGGSASSRPAVERCCSFQGIIPHR